MALSTVSAILKRIGLGKRSRLEPLEPPNRYECSRPGELLHIDVKKLARFSRPGQRMLGRYRGRFETAAGYEYVHVCVDVECPRFGGQRWSGGLWFFFFHLLVVDRRQVGECRVESDRVVEGLDVVEDGGSCFSAAAQFATAKKVFRE
jgi:hypothetical protein